jgi:hypothetical protein
MGDLTVCYRVQMFFGNPISGFSKKVKVFSIADAG